MSRDEDDDRPRRRRDDDDDFEERRPSRGRDDRDDDDRPRRRSGGDRDDDDDRRRPRRYRDDDDDDYRRRPDIGQDAGMRMLLPVGRSGWAIAAGYLGLLSVLCVPGPFALLCGIMAVREINRDSKKHGMGRAIFGIIMGSLASLVVAIGLIGVAAGFWR